MQMKGQVAIPSTAIIELSSETAVFPSSLLVFPFLIYFIKFSSAQLGSYFLSSFTQLTWMLLKTSLTANKIYSHVFSRWKLHVDERAVQERSRHSAFKCEQMTTHLFFCCCFFVTSCHLNPTLLHSYWCLTQITAVLYCGLRAWMTPQGNRFCSCCCGRSIYCDNIMMQRQNLNSSEKICNVKELYFCSAKRQSV